MVKITGIRKSVNSESGVEFFSAILSETTPQLRTSINGNQRLELPTGSLPLSGITEESIAKSLIGTELPGKMVHTKVEPYTFVGKDGSEVTSDHRWVYNEVVAQPAKVAPKAEVVEDLAS